jgi:site-specific DNA-methyltransferase (adenine-specific)
MILLGDCLELMKDIEDKSIDMILTDLPYGTTAAYWDNVIDFDLLWKQYKRIIKHQGAIVLTAVQPFTTKLIASNYDMFKYCWVWRKRAAANFVHAPNMPLTVTEDIVVFSHGVSNHAIQSGNNRMHYYPQGIKESNHIKPMENRIGDELKYARPGFKPYKQRATNYPNNLIIISGKRITSHPTEKPVELFEYLIRTYTKEGETVLDSCAGSGTTAIACINTKRNYICMEIDKKYYAMIKDRVKHDDVPFKNRLQEFLLS